MAKVFPGRLAGLDHPVGRRKAGTRAKGTRLEGLAKRALEAQGALVEPAPRRVFWSPERGFGTVVGGPTASTNVQPDGQGEPPGQRFPGYRPRAMRSDFFSLWDLLAVWPDGTRVFYQVTTPDHLSHRRRKILAAKFPVTPVDAILVFHGGRGRHFRMYRSPFTVAEPIPLPIPPEKRASDGISDI